MLSKSIEKQISEYRRQLLQSIPHGIQVAASWTTGVGCQSCEK